MDEPKISNQFFVFTSVRILWKSITIYIKFLRNLNAKGTRYGEDMILWKYTVSLSVSPHLSLLWFCFFLALVFCVPVYSSIFFSLKAVFLSVKSTLLVELLLSMLLFHMEITYGIKVDLHQKLIVMLVVTSLLCYIRYKGGPPIPRKMISQGVNQRNFSVEVYLLCLKLIDARDGSECTVRLSKKVFFIFHLSLIH